MTSIPLRAVSSARFDTDSLVPRTPHSRSGRFDEVDLGVPVDATEDTDNDDLSDSDPLLRHDTTEGPPNFPLQTPGAGQLPEGARFSIIGLTTVLSLVFLVGIAYQKSGQGTPSHYGEVQSEHSNVTLISYENYTTFPLAPKQYRAECRRVNREMRHMSYWTDMMMDVPHPPAPGVCESTVTYMLGSEVGLMGELALLAQVAALADSVSACTSWGSEIGSKALIMNSNNGRFSLMIHNGTGGSGYLFIPKYMRSAPVIHLFIML